MGLEQGTAHKGLKDLVAARGYIKGAITRLHTKVLDHEMIKSAPVATLHMLKLRATTAFDEYEQINKSILCLDPDDQEKLEEYEDKYFEALSTLNSEISIRETTENLTAAPPHPTHAPTRLPPIDVPVFCGKSTEYIPFINLFNSLIHNNKSLDSVQKLYYLRTYLKSEPLDLIKNLPLEANNYEKAHKLLEDRYNNKYKIVNDHIHNILDMKPISRATSSTLREFISTTRQQLAALANLDTKVIHWDAIILCILSRKLDTFTARAYQLERDCSKDPSMQEFLGYLEKRALALENADQDRYQPHQGVPVQHRQSAPGKMVGHVTGERPQSQCEYYAATVGAAATVSQRGAADRDGGAFCMQPAAA
ncbi:uncharacterized protein isoform X2 [Choristoneura fumiferana]|uniref:uncharacterized protein isoform X2 n=1 Tax=Choristoneura fumiferana TaxID=7141 RepID=UPI003D15D77D